jgi:ribosomal protein S18 acetylase RimI-like enzyme
VRYDNCGVIRAATAEDVPFLRAMLLEAAYWRPGTPRPGIDEALARPEIACYVEGWGRAGDAGVVAVEDGHPVGAAWYRLFTAGRPGYGFIDEQTPELSLGVLEGARRRGVGTALVTALLGHARDAGFSSISVSVEPDNPAVGLYERAGFVRVGESGAWTMVAEL